MLFLRTIKLKRRVKSNVSFIVLVLILPLLGILYFYPMMDEHHSVSQTDPALISLIRRQYLIPPRSFNSPVNTQKSIQPSKVTTIVQKILRNKTHGYFLECRAYDGEFLSNTIELEHYFKWEGLLLEGDPKYHRDLLRTRRNAWVAPVCLSPIPHPMNLTMKRDREGGDGLVNIREPRATNEPASREQLGTSFQVPCFPLYTLVVAALKRKELDYLSLDINGLEWQVIQTIPFDLMQIKVISFKYNLNMWDTSARQIDNYLKEKGYVQEAKLRDGLYGGHLHDYVYAHNNISGKDLK